MWWHWGGGNCRNIEEGEERRRKRKIGSLKFQHKAFAVRATVA